MFRTILYSAFGAGLALCAALTILQFLTTEPLILHSEIFENAGAAAAPDHSASVSTDHGEAASADHVHSQEEWAPADGFERTFFTALANFVMSVAATLMLLGCMAVRGEPIDARRGLLWGVAAFFALSLLPALGLPPELPGTPAADIYARQAWWLATAAGSAGGLACLVFGRGGLVRAVGLGLIVLPHFVGAPIPPAHEVAYPGALAGEFVVASLAVSALLWIGAGVAGGWLHNRLTAAA
jgi:cobalt transporter subunit CbtA